jgi:hypothetical protein
MAEKTIKIHSENDHSFEAVKNRDINKTDELLEAELEFLETRMNLLFKSRFLTA